MNLKRQFIFILSVWMIFFLPKITFAVQVYETATPIHLTLGHWGKFGAGNYDSSKIQVERSLHYAASSLYEMTNGKHRLGKIRIINEPREYYHINWVSGNVGANGANAVVATYLPYSQNAIGSNRINIGGNVGDSSSATGIVIAHEMGHFITPASK